MVEQRILLTIAARGGSKGVKNKNIRNLAGRPLIAYTIEQAKKWGRADRIICSTDSHEIAEIAKEYGAEVPFMRPADLATDTAGKVPVLRHALKSMEQLTGERFDIVVDLDATAPIRTKVDIENALSLFKNNKAKTVFSVTPSRRNPYFNMIELNQEGYATVSKQLETPLKRRQDAPNVYDANASIYVYDRSYLLDENVNSAVSDKSLIYIMDELSTFDIDSERDFIFIEYLIEKGIIKL